MPCPTLHGPPLVTARDGFKHGSLLNENYTLPRVTSQQQSTESRLSHVHTRVAGWVEQLYVNTTGEYVRAGQPVARIFSQELLSSQAEYLAARRFAASGYATSVVASGRMRLRVLGMTDREIGAIERSGNPIRLVTVTAPSSGVVVNRGVSVGTAVDPSTELLTLANMGNVWVYAEVPETGIRAIRPGTPVRLDFPTVGIASIRGRVEFVYAVRRACRCPPPPRLRRRRGRAAAC